VAVGAVVEILRRALEPVLELGEVAVVGVPIERDDEVDGDGWVI